MLRAFATTIYIFVAVAPATGKPFDYLKKIRGQGPSNKAIHGNAWSEQAGQPVHHPASESAVDKEVREEEESRAKTVAQKTQVPFSVPKIRAPLGITDARAMAHLRKTIHGGPAPAPGGAPGPAPWTEDPEWMVDGKRGDKSSTVPITEQFKGLASVPIPEQGFHGRPIQHEDMDTMTGDWNREFGPKVNSAYEVCKQNPANWWCKQHMHELGGPGLKVPLEPQGKPPWSGARSLLAPAFPTLAALFLWAC